MVDLELSVTEDTGLILAVGVELVVDLELSVTEDDAACVVSAALVITVGAVVVVVVVLSAANTTPQSKNEKKRVAAKNIVCLFTYFHLLLHFHLNGNLGKYLDFTEKK